ncbi:phage tail tube protein [Lactiplantibacillus plantarum]|uniref:phage tail tube protein n=1 Tax=Lactiplantibacillus plantarum TaxID=1590 RepID=UPI003F52AD06
MADATTPTADPNDRNVQGSIQENYLDEYWVGKTAADKTINWLYLGDGITTVTPKYADKKKSAAYYNGGGQERQTVTGVTSSYDISGDRSIGNPAQDDIAGMKQKTGSQRERMFRKVQWLQEDDGSLTPNMIETGMGTFTDIDDGGGAADDNGSFKTTMTYNAAPGLLAKTQAADMKAALADTPCQNALILHVKANLPDGTSK